MCSGPLLQAMLFDDFLYHGVILSYIAVEETVQQVAVGMPVTRHPPHRSRRAARPHRAPALGRDAQALRRIRMHNVGFGKPLGSESIHPLPGHTMALTAPSYGVTPVAEYAFPDDP